MKKLSLTLMMVFFLVGTGWAAETATKDECVAMVNEAVAMADQAGLEAVYSKIQTEGSPFIWKDSYVYAVDMGTGVVVAHPNTKLVGKNFRAVKDKKGKLFVMEYISLAKKKGEGWTTFMWPKLGESEPSLKHNFVKAVPGKTVLFGAGAYE